MNKINSFLCREGKIKESNYFLSFMGGANQGKHSCFFLCGEDCLREDIMLFPRRGNLFRVIYWVIIHGMGEVEEERVLLLSEEKTISIGGIF